MNLNEFAKECHEVNVSKGWWENKSYLAMRGKHALIHSEISEALECVRDGDMQVRYADGKPEGFPVEIADVFIRTLDYLFVDYEDQQRYLSYRLAGELKRTVNEPHTDPASLAAYLDDMHGALVQSPFTTVHPCYCLAAALGFDLMAIAREKLEYNKTRTHRHGGRLL